MTSAQNPATGTHRTTGLTHWLRREWYLARVDGHLEGLVPGRERKKVIGALRDEIDAESSGHGLRAALAGLGDPRALAHSYADGARPQPRWVFAIIAAGGALLLYGVVFFSYALGMLAVVEQSPLEEAHAPFLFTDVFAFSGESGFGIGRGGGAAWILVPALIAGIVFLLASRSWRVFLRRQPSEPIAARSAA